MKNVNIVHAIGTSGPLYESLGATFQRLEHLFNIKDIAHNRENLDMLKKKKINLGGIENEVAKVLSSHLSNYNDSWPKISEMLDRILPEDFRFKSCDSYGNGWVFSWHCSDFVGFDINPRRRDMGYHNIYDFYHEALREHGIDSETIQFLFHPISTYKEAHKCATSYINSPELYQILCRRIIEREWFPAVYKAGCQAERPDSNWFLEQWIPFDISSMAIENYQELDKMTDFKNGRSGDWRLAPKDWSVYHPHHDNYQKKGESRRWIGRALNVLNRIASIDQYEMDKAFERAKKDLPTLVGIASHDFRDLQTEVEYIQGLIKVSKQKYPEVKFRYCSSLDGFKEVIDDNYKNITPLRLELKLNRDPKDDVPNLEIKTIKGEVFGPQPFLAIETISKRFIHDNLDFSTCGNRWYYAFHTDTLPLNDVRRVGIAANDKVGNTFVKVLKVN
ncbi:MAG: hypothetical protein CBE11_03725 [Rickettsiales bacterium TMED251]|nr:MAG: hypothetical protein CBE11_03725 [Rickettsiales bacterium TMED251]